MRGGEGGDKANQRNAKRGQQGGNQNVINFGTTNAEKEGNNTKTIQYPPPSLFKKVWRVIVRCSARAIVCVRWGGAPTHQPGCCQGGHRHRRHRHLHWGPCPNSDRCTDSYAQSDNAQTDSQEPDNTQPDNAQTDNAQTDNAQTDNA